MSRPRARLDQTAVAAAFAPDGLRGVSAGEIARRAGIAKPTLYAHGRSKESVFLSCVEAAVERLLDRLYVAQERTKQLTARERIAALAQAVLERGREDPSAARLLHLTAHHRSSSVAAHVDAALARLPARITTVLRDDAGPERAAQIGVALFAAAGALALADDCDKDAARDLLADAFTAALDPVDPGGADAHVRSVGVY